MKEEIARIMKLVADGKLSPEDAAELIDAFTEDRTATEASAAEERAYAEARETVPPSGQAPPRPDGAPGAPKPPFATIEGELKDAFRSVVAGIEKLGKEAQEVDWKGVADKARSEAQRGFESIRTGIEDVTRGKLDLGGLFNDAGREVELPFSLPAGKALRIENECGDVAVTGGDVLSEVTAVVRVRAGSADEARRLVSTYTLLVEEGEGAVSIRQPHQPGLSVRLNVTIPEASLVEARADSGDVTVKETRGAVRATTRTGNVRVHGAEGAVEARSETGQIILGHISNSVIAETRTGNVTLEGIRGDAKISTASGNVTVKALANGGATVEAVSGNVHLEFAEPPIRPVELSTVGGSILATVPSGGDYAVTLSALRGEVRTDVALTDLQRTPQRVTGTAGAGGTKFNASSVAGNVELRLSSDRTA